MLDVARREVVALKNDAAVAGFKKPAEPDVVHDEEPPAGLFARLNPFG